MRSALLEVMGVTRAQVMLEGGEAIVTYDPGAVTIDALITAVNNTVGPFGVLQYNATVKEPSAP